MSKLGLWFFSKKLLTCWHHCIGSPFGLKLPSRTTITVSATRRSQSFLLLYWVDDACLSSLTESWDIFAANPAKAIIEFPCTVGLPLKVQIKRSNRLLKTHCQPITFPLVCQHCSCVVTCFSVSGNTNCAASWILATEQREFVTTTPTKLDQFHGSPSPWNNLVWLLLYLSSPGRTYLLIVLFVGDHKLS